jgi:hypothetical protein
MGPDVVGVAGHFRSGPGVDDDECVDETVAVVVERREVHVRVGEFRCLARHRPCVRFHGARAGIAVGVLGHGPRQPEWADHLAGDVDQAMTDVGEILADAAARDDTGREEEIVKGGRRPGHRRVREFDEDDNDPDGPAQRSPVGRRGTNDALRCAEREQVAWDDQSIVETGPILLLNQDAMAGRNVRCVLQAAHAFTNSFLKLGARRDKASHRTSASWMSDLISSHTNLSVPAHWRTRSGARSRHHGRRVGVTVPASN